MGLMDDVDKIVFDMAFSSADQMSGVESFTYHQHGGNVVQVYGSVLREQTTFDPIRMAPVRRLRVWVSKEQIPFVDCPGDSVEIAETLGGQVKRFAVQEILNQDAGGWELLL